MKVLAFSDLHCDAAAAARLVNLARGVDLVVGAGDFANARRGLSVCIDILKAIETPTLLVPGNNESHDELKAACAQWPAATVLHCETVHIAGLIVYGIGGGIPKTPFGDWSFDLSEDMAADHLRRCVECDLLISHSPPKGFVDVSSSGKSLGSVAIRDALDRLFPKLVICGHIHGSAGATATSGPTQIVNAGPAGMILELQPRKRGAEFWKELDAKFDAENSCAVIVRGDETLDLSLCKVYIDRNVHFTGARFAHLAPPNSIYAPLPPGPHRIVVREADLRKPNRLESNTLEIHLTDPTPATLALTLHAGQLRLDRSVAAP